LRGSKIEDLLAAFQHVWPNGVEELLVTDTPQHLPHGWSEGADAGRPRHLQVPGKVWISLHGAQIPPLGTFPCQPSSAEVVEVVDGVRTAPGRSAGERRELKAVSRSTRVAGHEHLVKFLEPHPCLND